MGKILRVNLSSQRIVEESLEEGLRTKCFGGRGLAAAILFKELGSRIDPLSPENKLVFMTGPLTGAPFPGNAKFGIMAKSPLTGLWGESFSSGFFGPEMKFSGYDGIIFEGKASKPIYLWVHDGEAELRPASQMWGKTTGEVQKMIREEVKDEKARVAAVGTGGENQVKYACVISDLHHAAGRCGLGAVMGSKNLKAVAVRGHQKVKLADQQRFVELSRRAAKEAWHGKGKTLSLHGTASAVDDLQATGRLPTRNFKKCTFDGYEKISGLTMSRTILVKREGCYACRNTCKRIIKTDEPLKEDTCYGGPEYETIAAFGSLCMNDNLESIAKANKLCNRCGLDTISTGSSIAFAMECFENGLLTLKETEGINLEWGNHSAILQMIEKIARREGLGKLLSEGVRRASESIGGNAKDFAIHVKGLEVPMHEPRGRKGQGLSYATSNRGGCHLQYVPDDIMEDKRDLPIEIFPLSLKPLSRLDASPGKAKLVVHGENWISALETLVVCIFTPYTHGITPETILGILSAVTGMNVTAKELLTIGERALNLCRAFNVREGIDRKDDILPKRFMEPLPEGPYKGENITLQDLDVMLDAYYSYRGWDRATGIPTRSKLELLGLKEVADEIDNIKRL